MGDCRGEKIRYFGLTYSLLAVYFYLLLVTLRFSVLLNKTPEYEFQKSLAALLEKEEADKQTGAAEHREAAAGAGGYSGDYRLKMKKEKYGSVAV